MQETPWKMWMRRWDYQNWTVESGLDGGDVIFIQLIWGNAEYLFHVPLETAEAIGQPSSSETCGQKGSIKPGILRHMNAPFKSKSSVDTDSVYFLGGDFGSLLAPCP